MVRIGMPMDRPGGQTTVSSVVCNNTNNASTILREDIFKDSPCTSCNPIKVNTQISDTHYISNANYMQSRCITYDQKLAYNPAPFIQYFSTAGVPIEPSDSPNGTQVRETNNCYSFNNCYTPLSPTKCNTTIYKPNNTQFAQSGSVSSGTRISRLKYNTLNGFGAAYNSAAGAVGVNTGFYQTEPSPSYYNKLKPQRVVYPYKTGNSVYCKPEYSMCTNA